MQLSSKENIGLKGRTIIYLPEAKIALFIYHWAAMFIKNQAGIIQSLGMFHILLYYHGCVPTSFFLIRL